MTSILRFLRFFTLGTWVGSILYLSSVVAPGAFAALPSRDLAGALVGVVLGRLHLIGIVAGVAFLSATVALGRSLGALGRPAAVLVILRLLLTLASQYGVSPRMGHLRALMGSVDVTPRDAGRPGPAAVPAALDRGAHHRPAGEFPAPRGALRPLAHDLPRILSHRLRHDRLTEGCAIASRNF